MQIFNCKENGTYEVIRDKEALVTWKSRKELKEMELPITTAILLIRWFRRNRVSFLFSLHHRINSVCGTDFILIRFYSVIHFIFSKVYVRSKASLWCIIWQVCVVRQTNAISEPDKQPFSRVFSFCHKILCGISIKWGPDNEV